MWNNGSVSLIHTSSRIRKRRDGGLEKESSLTGLAVERVKWDVEGMAAPPGGGALIPGGAFIFVRLTPTTIGTEYG